MNVKGFKLPIQAIHPITKESIPVFVTNYVLSDYGEGAVMGVPAHDKRDEAFAQEYHLPVKEVLIEKDGKQVLTNSQELNGLTVKEAMKVLLGEAKEQHWGQAATHYRLRDWLISRQRYWGAPVPAIHCEHCGVVPVPYEDLPVTLPPMSTDDLEKMSGSEAISPLGSMTNDYCLL